MAHLLTKEKKKSVTSLCIKSFKGTVTQKKWFRPLKVLKSVIEMKSYMLGIIFQQFKYSCFFSGQCSLPTACLWSSQIQGSARSQFYDKHFISARCTAEVSIFTSLGGNGAKAADCQDPFAVFTTFLLPFQLLYIF